MGKVGEGFWRFLAAVMLFAVGWAMWIFYQLSPPPPLATRAAFEAAAKAGVSQKSKGVIVPAAATPKEPLANPEKLKYSDSIAIPEAERK